MRRQLACALLLIGLAPSAASSADIDGAEVMRWLTDPKWEGRGNESEYSMALAAELERRLASFGGVVGHQDFETEDGTKLRNVHWLREGSDPQAGWVVLGAHYDHLGRGAEGAPHAGQVYPGADDNASGVTVALGVVARLADYPIAERGVCVAFFAGEEIGLLGSRAFLRDGPIPAGQVVAMFNLDTVGRLQSGGLTVFGVESALGFSEILDGIDSAHGLHPRKVARGSGASDDRVFADAGIPTLHLFTGANADYHRPSDTFDKVDLEGLERLADFVVDLVDYCAGAATRLEFVPPGAERARPDPRRATEGRRRVSFGSIPDFQFEGRGVRITGVLANSPAARAGLRDGDVIVGFGGEPVNDLTDYSEAMKSHEPGDEVRVEFLRAGESRSVTVTLVEWR